MPGSEGTRLFLSDSCLCYAGDGSVTGRIEDFNEIIDKAAGRLPSSREPSKERDVFAKKLLRAFPYFVVICILLWTVIIFLQGGFTFSRLIEVLCLVFVSGFAILGVPCTYYSDRGVFSMWATFAFTVLMTCIMWIAGKAMGQVYWEVAVAGFLQYLGISLSPAPSSSSVSLRCCASCSSHPSA